MDVSTFLLAVPVFFVLYALGDALINSRRRTSSWTGGGPKTSRFSAESLRQFSRTVGHLGMNQALLRARGFRQRLDTLLLRSGYPFGWKAEDLLVNKEASVIITALLLWAMGETDPFLWVIILICSFWLFDLALYLRGNTRKAEMQRELPGMVDLLALSMESGLDLIVAMERIFEKMKPGPSREELQVLLQESRLGSARQDILKRWAYRTNLPDAQSLSSLIIQSEEMGTPLANVLRNYSEDMRNRRILRAEELAGKIPVKILFPMMVFFFPVVFVIILGPVALQFLKGYK